MRWAHDELLPALRSLAAALMAARFRFLPDAFAGAAGASPPGRIWAAGGVRRANSATPRDVARPEESRS